MGLKGTVVCLPQCEHTVRVSVLEKVEAEEGVAPRTDTRFILQALHLLGAFLNCLSRKNSCSPAVKRKSMPQSMHVNVLSWNSIEKKAPFVLVRVVPRTRRQSAFLGAEAHSLTHPPQLF